MTKQDHFEAWIFKVAPSVCFVLAGFIWTNQAAQGAIRDKAMLDHIDKIELRLAEHDIALALLKDHETQD